MREIELLLQHPLLAAYVNLQVFAAVLLALLVMRLFGPVIDFLNPISIAINVIYWVRDSLVRSISYRHSRTRLGGGAGIGAYAIEHAVEVK